MDRLASAVEEFRRVRLGDISLSPYGGSYVGAVRITQTKMFEALDEWKRSRRCSTSQSHRSSWLEVCASTSFGFLISVGANYAVLPLFGYWPHPTDSLLIAGLFTGISLIRSFVFRRIFEALRVKGILP